MAERNPQAAPLRPQPHLGPANDAHDRAFTPQPRTRACCTLTLVAPSNLIHQSHPHHQNPSENMVHAGMLGRPQMACNAAPRHFTQYQSVLDTRSLDPFALAMESTVACRTRAHASPCICSLPCTHFGCRITRPFFHSRLAPLPRPKREGVLTACGSMVSTDVCPATQSF